MPIISFLNPKGGSGKTTISTNIAQALYSDSQKVLLVDSDPQGSARDWHAMNEDNPLTVISLDRANNIKSLKDLAASYDFVVIDGAAKLEDMMAATIKVSDFVLIPVTPSPYDLWAAADLVDFIKARQEVTDGKPAAAFIISRAIGGTTLAKEVIDVLDEHDLYVFKTHITQRQAYPRTASEGRTVFDSNNKEGILEVTALVNELAAFIEGGNGGSIK